MAISKANARKLAVSYHAFQEARKTYEANREAGFLMREDVNSLYCWSNALMEAQEATGIELASTAADYRMETDRRLRAMERPAAA